MTDWFGGDPAAIGPLWKVGSAAGCPSGSTTAVQVPGALLDDLRRTRVAEGSRSSLRTTAAPGGPRLAGPGPGTPVAGVAGGVGARRAAGRQRVAEPGGTAGRGRWWNRSRKLPGPSWTPSSPRRAGDRFRAGRSARSAVGLSRPVAPPARPASRRSRIGARTPRSPRSPAAVTLTTV
ncbi:hypothetical protein HBB16_14450 [Pseudonocardia sp. MCCB 268]|nr:hypothetical protein [Pseudonocardia cytotoxica]